MERMWLLLPALFLAGLLCGVVVAVPFRPAAVEVESIRLVGSTTVLPIAKECAEEFSKFCPHAKIVVEGGGSGRGFAELIDGLCDIALASRGPKPEEIELAEERGVELFEHRIALDGIAVIVNPSVVEGLDEPLKLTLEEIGKIFAGVYTRWSEVKEGLPDEEIRVFTREPGSGTRKTFEEFCLEPFGLEVKPGAMEAKGNPVMRTRVEETDYSIGYVGLGFVFGEVEVVHVAREEGEPYLEPTKENVREGVYPLSRYLYMFTAGEPEEGSLIDRFIDFVRSPTGQVIVEEVGFVALYPVVVEEEG